VKEIELSSQHNSDLNSSFQGKSKRATQLRIAIVVNFITTYREGFYQKLLETEGLSVKIFCHEPPIRLNLPSIHKKFAPYVHLSKGKFFFGEKFVFSNLPWKELFFKYDVVYVEGNLRYLSHAFLATILRLSGRRVVLWTMVHSFRNNPFGLALRLTWYRLFKQLLVYSDAEASYLSAKGFNGQIVGINNGVDYDSILKEIHNWTQVKLLEWRDANGLNGRKIFLSCSRLEKKNKFDQILLVLPQLIKHHPTLLWCVIGDGPERQALELQTKQLGLTSHVRFLGRIYAESEQAPWFLSSQLLAHPGAIGLTLLHAMAFGLPVVTHNVARHHGPEFSATVSGEYGLTHHEDVSEDIARSLLELLNDEKRCQEMGHSGQELVKSRYNTSLMVSRFLKMTETQNS